MLKEKRLLLLSILIVLEATLLPMYGSGGVGNNYFDKVVHFGIYFFLGISIMITYSNKLNALKFLLFWVFAGIGIEILQQYIPGRDTSIYDALANTFGIIGALYIFEMKDRWKKS